MDIQAFMSLLVFGGVVTLFAFLAGRLSASTDENNSRVALIFAALGIVALIISLVMFDNIAQTAENGNPKMLQLGETYEIIPSDEAYLKLKDGIGEERVYAVKIKYLPIEVKRFKYEEHRKTLLVPEDPKSAFPPATSENENK
jgi:hypothetical protein